ncbi:hypothetical protein [Legionella bononiensis]|uniref:Uncharacterized protein n=1 Tax=Legionella bononiensis TaxID=2793102 RepID=A0ABS1W6G2_9GAMM|nr:hypothetical protein [Legionella bononiensis]MBL7478365.1 hypothetical protein [Legionella bononiensis]MBL7524962.1 hypothetical protein [Legionella bononiensis]MBL7561259.1 hypothetical protein [Legionella bononiensis]
MMNPIKLIGTLILIFIPWGFVSADEYHKQAISIITNCYNTSEDKDDMVVQCIKNKLKDLPNPGDYRLNVKTSNPDAAGHFRVIIFMINSSGYMVYCIGNADLKTMKIKSCVQDRGEPLSPAQELSIDTLLDI